MRNYIHTVRVMSQMKHGQFPIDMLRYDSLIPYSELDSQFINQSIESRINVKENDAPIIITLTKIDIRTWEPTTPRWNSFSWSIVEHERY